MSNLFLSINNSDTVAILYSTTAADVLASLLLDLKKVNVESSIFITEFEYLLSVTFGCLYAGDNFLLQRLSIKC